MTATRALLREPSVTAMAETFKVLGDVTRVRILDAIAQSELCVNDIAGIVGLSESAVSHQLRLLRGMRLVRPRREGRQVFYMLDDHHIVRLFEQGLEHVLERNGAVAATPTLRPLDPSTHSGSPRATPRGESLGVVPSVVEGRQAQPEPGRGASRGLESRAEARRGSRASAGRGGPAPVKKKMTSRGA